ncbi:MAG: CapA family protein [Clostridia bacterium]|nr:CapA family protein [Clostridia bacterium]
MRIIVGADFVPTAENIGLFEAGDVDALFGEEIKQILSEADYRIFNLECALTDEDTPLMKAGVCLRAPTATIEGYRAAGVDMLGIANNHVLDHGYEGFLSTVNTIDKAGIARVGGGFSQEEASKPAFFELEGKRIGVYACCEHEFSWARDYGFGSNGFEPLDSLDEVAEAKAECDYLIVLYHGGKEHYRYPSPRLTKVCRRMAEKGADLVLCQHTHCIGTAEDHNGSRIVYGQGNFVFVKDKKEYPFEGWFTGMLVAVDITDEGVKYEYIPYELTDKGVRLSHDPSLLEGLYARSKEVEDDVVRAKKYAEFAAGMIGSRYVKRMVGHPIDDEFMMNSGKAIFHYMECEAHYEALHTGLKYMLGYPIFEDKVRK